MMLNPGGVLPNVVIQQYLFLPVSLFFGDLLE